MSKSLDFCIKRASDPIYSSYYDRNWQNAIELSAKSIFEKYIGELRESIVSKTDDDGNISRVKIQIEFNPNLNFEYFTSFSCIHDGCLIYKLSALEECVQNVMWGITYNKTIGVPKNGDLIKYIVGNFVSLDEYIPHLDSPKMRTTILLPLIMIKLDESEI